MKSELMTLLFGLALGSSLLMAEEAKDLAKSKSHEKPTAEMRAKWAEHHEKVSQAHHKMAECLRSDKPVKDCHEEMRKNAPMGKMGMGKGQECAMGGGSCEGPRGPRKGRHDRDEKETEKSE